MISILDKCIISHASISIYGAGVRGKRFLDLLAKCGYKDLVQCFIVADKTGNPDEIEGIPVKALAEADAEVSYVFIALADQLAAKEISVTLKDHGYMNVTYFSGEDHELVAFATGKNFFEKLDSRINVSKKEYDEYGFFHLVIDEIYQWRFYYTRLKSQVRVKEEFFPRDRLLEAYEESYGTYLPLSEAIKDVKPETDKRIKIFRALGAFDKAPLKLQPQSFVIDIQLGAALTDERICDLADNTGENISELNMDFSECTALYWIWKNVTDADYVGLFHYARYIDVTEVDLARLDGAGVDIVLTTPMLAGAPIRDFFCSGYIPGKDWRYMEEAVLENFPEYADTWEAYSKAFAYPGANMSIMKKEIFDEYAEFAFTVALDIHEGYKKEGVIRNDRYAGYIMENLLAMFVMHNKDRFKIATADLLFAKEYDW